MDAATLYATITIVTSLILLVMVLVGGETELDTDVDIDADVDLDMDADVDADVEVAAAGPGHFGLKLILGFIIGFGLGGFLAEHNDWSVPSVLCGLIGGVCIYTIEFQLLKLLYAQQANTQTRASSVVGQTATVTHAIGPGGTGEIKAVTPQTGQSLFLRARAVDAEKAYAVGDQVTIKSVGTGLAQVE